MSRLRPPTFVHLPQEAHHGGPLPRRRLFEPRAEEAHPAFGAGPATSQPRLRHA